ncbi:CAP domain-containing protein [Achromobacter xylosoxidans]|uniref:CAP domain-containing protein n=1 Tax=Alcaligenes xylosoxydans xylosoxydans TaxID=85698 RepID=UPI0034D40D03
MKKQTLLVSAALPLLLSACNGGGGGSEEDSIVQTGGPSKENPIYIGPPSEKQDVQGAAAPAPESAPAPTANASSMPPPSPPGAQPIGALVSCYTVTGSLPLPATQTPTLLPAPGSALVTNYQELATPDEAGLCYANYQRELVGLPPFVSEPQLARAAFNHSHYLLHNTPFEGHDETPGKPFFTGIDPAARIAQAGYRTSATSEVLAMRLSWVDQPNSPSTLSPGSALIQGLIAAPFHRVGLLGSMKSAGSGYDDRHGPTDASQDRNKRPDTCPTGTTCTITATEFVHTINMADSHQAAGDDFLIASPHDGQRGITPDWKNTEWPDPYPGTFGQIVGYPVTLQAVNRSLKLDVVGFEIKDPGGRKADCELVDHSYQNHPQVNMAGYASGLAVCTPRAPLQANTTYTVHVTGNLNNKPMDVRWSFTTQ